MPYCLTVPQTKALQYYLVVPLINASLSFCPKDHSPTLLLSLWLMSHCLGVPPTLHHCLVVPLKIAPLSLCLTNKLINVHLPCCPTDQCPTDQCPTAWLSHWSGPAFLSFPLINAPLYCFPSDQCPSVFLSHKAMPHCHVVLMMKPNFLGVHWSLAHGLVERNYFGRFTQFCNIRI